MIPLKSLYKLTRLPAVTRLLILVNVLVFVAQLGSNLAHSGGWQAAMALRPACYFSPGACGISLPGQSQLLWKPLFVSMFLHADILHLGFNMLFLAVFGPGVEDLLGRFRFLLVYLGCGLAAAAAHIVTHPFSPIPTIGASGAIAGVLGAYLILLPRTWILGYLPPIFVFPVPAPLFLLVWIAGQLGSALANLPVLVPQSGGGGIAWTAHLGGFAAGVLVGWSVKPWWSERASSSS